MFLEMKKIWICDFCVEKIGLRYQKLYDVDRNKICDNNGLERLKVKLVLKNKLFIHMKNFWRV